MFHGHRLGKEDLCQCGCRGWCTFFVILVAVMWDMMHGACGSVATLDLFGKPFGANHPESLLALAGSAMSCILVLCEIRADWPAWNLVSGPQSHLTYFIYTYLYIYIYIYVYTCFLKAPLLPYVSQMRPPSTPSPFRDTTDILALMVSITFEPGKYYMNYKLKSCKPQDAEIGLPNSFHVLCVEYQRVRCSRSKRSI